MIFFLILLLLIIFNGMEFSPANSFNDKYLDKANTTAINGIFVILVVFSHYAGYADFGGIYDEAYLILREHLNQLVVTTFLFYSGYGMMEGIKRKGQSYARKTVSKFWKLLLRYDCAVILFLALDYCLKNKYPIRHTLLAFTSWTTVGNSNWYITAILMLYICFWISFTISMLFAKGSAGRKIGLLLLICLTILCVYIQMKIDRPRYCFNTMMLFPLGALYSEFRRPIESLFRKFGDIWYFFAILSALGLYVVFFFHRWKWGIEGYTVWTFAFIGLILLITMKASICNGALEWFGTHVFSIYILQRLPMMVLDHFGCIDSHKYISLIISFAVTAIIALLFEKATDTLINIITRTASKSAA